MQRRPSMPAQVGPGGGAVSDAGSGALVPCEELNLGPGRPRSPSVLPAHGAALPPAGFIAGRPRFGQGQPPTRGHAELALGPVLGAP